MEWVGEEETGKSERWLERRVVGLEGRFNGWTGACWG